MTSASLKIAFVIHDLRARGGGQSRYVEELARRFSQGHDVTVFSNTFDCDLTHVRWRHVPALRTSALTTVLSFRAIEPWVRRGGFDIVHAQGLCGGTQDVITAHMCLAGRLASMRRADGTLPLRQEPWRRVVLPLERAAFRSSRRVLAVSSLVARDLAVHYARRHDVEVIHHGVDTRRFRPGTEEDRARLRARFGVPAERTVALYVGELLKGAPNALRAIRETPGVHLHVVSGSDVASMAPLVRSLGLAERVTFEGFSDAIEEVYRGADFFLYPSEYDTFGMVVAEAMASGLPVIVSTAAGVAELISDGVEGFVVEPEDLQSIGARCERLREPSVRATIGSAARARALEMTWDVVADRTLRVYREIVAERSAA